MGILNLDNDNQGNAKLPIREFKTHEELENTIIYNKDKSLDTIQDFIEGYKWVVDYFLQVRNKNDIAKELDVNLPPTLQKYYRINNMVLYVSNPIEQDNPLDINGEAIVNSNVLCNTGDMILTTLAGGRKALLNVLEVTDRTYNLHNAYKITYKVYGFLDENPFYYNNLINKVIREFYYTRDMSFDGSNPIILDKDYVSKINLKIEYNNIIKHYLKCFFNSEYSLLCILYNNNTYVDPYVIDIFKRHVDNEIDIRIPKIRLLETTLYNEIYTIWELIISRSILLLPNVEKNLGFVKNTYLKPNIDLHAVSNIGIDYIVGIKDIENYQLEHFINNKLYNSNKPKDYKDPISADSSDIQSNNIPLFKYKDNQEPIKNKYYIFSNNFYNNDRTKCSYMENIILDYLEGKTIKEEDLYYVLNNYKYWNTIDQFYLIPILIIIVKDYIRNIIKVI